jgi:hypothetical protein
MVWAVSRSKDLSMMVENVEKPRSGGWDSKSQVTAKAIGHRGFSYLQRQTT